MPYLSQNAIDQIRLEGRAQGFAEAQARAAFLFGAIAYEQANHAMIVDKARAKQDVADHIKAHGEWVA